MANKLRVERIDALLNDLSAYSVGLSCRPLFDEALEELGEAGLDDGECLLDYLIFEKRLVDSYGTIDEAETDREDSQAELEALRASRLGVFEVEEEGIRDILGGTTYPIVVRDAKLISGRVFGGEYMPDYRVLDGLRPEMIVSTLKNSPNPALDIYKFNKAVRFNIPDESMLYQAVYVILRDPLELLSRLGYRLDEDEPGWYSVFRDDEYLADAEIIGDLFYLYCNNPVALEQLTTHIRGEDLRLVRKEVLSAEELIWLDE